jgi:glycosyltransferase involved in cell wall biosynthesis
MVPYKMVPLIVEAFAKMPDKKLVVIGDGTEYERAVAAAGAGGNISFLGYQTFEVLHDHMQRAKAFVFAAEEDFGITPVEAQACGTPVIAYGRGGALETVRDLSTPAPTGLFFETQTVEDIMAAVRTFEREGQRCTPANCRANAETFSEARFRQQIQDLVAATLAEPDGQAQPR